MFTPLSENRASPSVVVKLILRMSSYPVWAYGQSITPRRACHKIKVRSSAIMMREDERFETTDEWVGGYIDIFGKSDATRRNRVHGLPKQTL